MPDHRPLLRRFFAAYTKRMNDALKANPVIDTAGVIRSFADYFVEVYLVLVKAGVRRSSPISQATSKTFSGIMGHLALAARLVEHLC